MTEGHRRLRPGAAATPIGVLVIGVVVIWLIEAADATVLDGRLQPHGIRPRELEGLWGVLTAPLLHSDYAHVFSNSVPLLALGGLVAARGRRYWGLVSLGALVVGGGLTWLLGGSGNHIGASGIVFGYFGAILAAAWYERQVPAFGAAFLAIGFYSGLIAGLVPQEAISWEGHLFGFLGGAVVARSLAEPPPEPVEEPEVVYPWEIDEPWLDFPPED